MRNKRSESIHVTRPPPRASSKTAYPPLGKKNEHGKVTWSKMQFCIWQVKVTPKGSHILRLWDGSSNPPYWAVFHNSNSKSHLVSRNAPPLDWIQRLQVWLAPSIRPTSLQDSTHRCSLQDRPFAHECFVGSEEAGRWVLGYSTSLSLVSLELANYTN